MAKKKRLLRGKDRVFGGVCSGFAEYFGVDPTPVRILTVIFALCTGGLGAVAYLVAWLVMPEK